MRQLPMTPHRLLVAVSALALFASADMARAFCVSGVCFPNYTPTPPPAVSRPSSDYTFRPLPSGPGPEEVQREKEREKERQERERRIALAREAHARAIEHAQKGEWPQAVRNFQLALENDPGNEGVKKNLEQAQKLQRNEPALRSIFSERALDDMQDQARRLLSEGQSAPGAVGASIASGDASVVDLRFMGDRPLIVDPRTLKGKGGKVPPQPVITSTEALPPAQKERLSFFLQTRREEDIRRQGERLINPLSEPERYAEWLEQQKEEAKDAVARGMTERLIKKIKRERYEKELDAALKSFVEKENEAYALGYYQAHLDTQDEMVRLRKRFGMKDYSAVYRQEREGRNRAEVERLILQDIAEQREKAQEDPEFRRAREEAIDRIDAKMVQEREKAHRRAVQALMESLQRQQR